MTYYTEVREKDRAYYKVYNRLGMTDVPERELFFVCL